MHQPFHSICPRHDAYDKDFGLHEGRLQGVNALHLAGDFLIPFEGLGLISFQHGAVVSLFRCSNLHVGSSMGHYKLLCHRSFWLRELDSKLGKGVRTTCRGIVRWNILQWGGCDKLEKEHVRAELYLFRLMCRLYARNAGLNRMYVYICVYIYIYI